MYRVSFTGYRPEKLPFIGEGDPMCENLKERLLAQIGKLIADGADEFYTGMAPGVDVWAAEAVPEYKKAHPNVRLIAVIPCPEQPDRWREEDKVRYQGILVRCDKVMMISPRYEKYCMYKRNRALIDMCDVLVAVYDGQKGGTQYTVDYTRSRGRAVIIEYPL